MVEGVFNAMEVVVVLMAVLLRVTAAQALVSKNKYPKSLNIKMPWKKLLELSSAVYYLYKPILTALLQLHVAVVQQLPVQVPANATNLLVAYLAMAHNHAARKNNYSLDFLI